MPFLESTYLSAGRIFRENPRKNAPKSTVLLPFGSHQRPVNEMFS